MQRWQWLPIAAALAIVLAACGPTAQAPAPQGGAAEKPAAEQPTKEQPQYGGTVVLWNQSDPSSFDLHLESSYNVSQATGPAYDNLVRFAPLDPDQIVPDLAEKWEFSPDGKALTFTLRKGVKFHDGSNFTARDAKFSLDRMRGAIQGPGAVASPRRETLAVVASVEAVDDFTVALRLSRPSASILPALASGWQAILSKDWVEQGHDLKKEINGTGPFKLKQYIRGTSVELTRNEDYWNRGMPYLDAVKVFVIPDQGTALAAARTGQLSLMTLTASQEKTLAPDFTSGKLKLMPVRPCCGTGNPLHINATTKPLDDVRVRKAISLALDRPTIMRIQEAREGSTMAGHLTPGAFWALPPEELAKIPGYGPDKEVERTEARKLLAEAGYPSGLSLKILVRNEQGQVGLVTVFADQLAKVGINAEIDVRETSVVYDAVRKKDYQLAHYGGITSGDDPDLIYAEFFLCKAARNYHGICNQQLEELFNKQSRMLDPQERRKVAWEMERLALLDFGRLATYVTTGAWAVDARVRSWMPHPLRYNNDRFDGTWMAK